MRFQTTWIPLIALCILSLASHTESRRVRVQNRPVQSERVEDNENIEEENDSRAQPAIQYYRAEPKQDSQQNVVLVANDDDYNGYYGQPTQRSRSDYRPAVKATTQQSPRSKQQETRQPPVQTLRNYNKVNDDGSFTFGYEAADGSFKEETRGTDCVVRGKYGYIDPDGNKREFTYVSGNPCDPNNPDGEEEEEPSQEDVDENIPQNYPRRPPVSQRPVTVRPLPSTTRAAPTTVFQNTYASSSRRPQEESSEEEQEEQTIQIGQRPTARPSARPFVTQQASPTPTQRPRVQVINTTPVAPVSVYQQPTHAVSITPRPHRINTNPGHHGGDRYVPGHTERQPPATTYRPQVQYVSTAAPAYQQQGAEFSSFPSSTPSSFPSSTKGQQLLTKPQGSVDFESEFKKFQQENYVSTTTPLVSTAKPFKPSQLIKMEPIPQQHQPQQQQQGQGLAVTGNPIYQSQLVFDPATGQYDTQLYQQVPQGDGDFSFNHRIQPYVHQSQQPQAQQLQQQQQLVSLEQQQQQQPQGPYHQNQFRHQQVEQQQRHEAPVPQQLYQQQHKDVQFINSQQLFAQQLELQQAQLYRDRIEANNKKPAQSHRFGGVPVAQRQVQNPLQNQGQQFYYIQPSQGGGQQLGQIDQFLRGHQIEY